MFRPELNISSATAIGWHRRPTEDSFQNETIRTELGGLIHSTKNYGDHSGVANSADIQRLAVLLAYALHETSPTAQWDLVLAVPSSRGNNRLPAMLAEQLSQLLSISKHDDQCLEYVRETQQMKNLQTLIEKKRNVSNAMIAKGGLLDHKRVLIIDDVLETGFTLSEAARACLAASAAAVSIAALSKTITYQSRYQVR